ncbi:nuclear transport factor 2 family protein [Lactococcus taiwanensis]|uniref:Nuclear transport factor 2 family protein n=2 Tax=Lactococcus taiwanensis TaxID=1151742 RepID=A0AA45KGD5_9LACT|nr:nuclear transport factor 2 family protein [Lactococcus taiwanensis]QSE76023.1 nuclear transport factor 2 family protein [Lactococcus taiwanensis]
MEDAKKIIILYKDLNDWMVSKQTARLGRLFTEEAYLKHMTGYIQPITEWLEQIDSGEIKYFESTEENVKVLEINNHSAKLLGKNQVKAQVWGSMWSGGLQQIYHFVKINDVWRITGSEASSY